MVIFNGSLKGVIRRGETVLLRKVAKHTQLLLTNAGDFVDSTYMYRSPTPERRVGPTVDGPPFS